MNLVMTFLGHKADLKFVYQPNVKRLATQTILNNDVVLIRFCLSYDNYVTNHVISQVTFM